MGGAVALYFADGSKVKTYLSPTDTTSDLLEKEEVKDRLTSSAARVWLIDSVGNGETGRSCGVGVMGGFFFLLCRYDSKAQ